MLTRINQADFKCVMAAMDLDHQLSDTSLQEAERSYAESELSLECDDRSPRSGRGAEWSRVEFELNLPSGCGAVVQDAEMRRPSEVVPSPSPAFTVIMEPSPKSTSWARIEGLSGVTWSPSPASNAMFEVFAQVEKPSGVLQT
ncbi:hypothetical protein PHYSODRAFT_320927 [Phytophthora sojae]|uniref:Uncharacterized protein n=1 Tax=Phytophthora sojae (strain P6497) TaxID=1094619 RepID=G4YI66_PHYSP|nr:hypothetical protein PHYSODRAFT_320927 [Phytophthora sojae]EGZ27077.1 hypothetical protein PHYSODRAFT_320927 [Phytophthora sojae]|eukprot:XP_009514352.1 hypothetical protein PHYSODRAFT_320927 [Phytophthora sojae]